MSEEIQVVVKLHSILQKRLSIDKKKKNVKISKESSILDLISSLGIELNPERLLLAKNGEVADLTDTLSDGDEIHLMLPISGG